jgi:hypothetical protein
MATTRRYGGASSSFIREVGRMMRGGWTCAGCGAELTEIDWLGGTVVILVTGKEGPMVVFCADHLLDEGVRSRERWQIVFNRARHCLPLPSLILGGVDRLNRKQGD